MKYILLTVLTISVLVSCRPKRSELRHEGGTVLLKQYTPALDASGVGYTSAGNGGVVFTNVHEDEKYTVIFHCQGHNKTFAIDAIWLFEKVNVGDKVDISYYDLMKGTRIVDYEFYDANKIGPQY